jgi:hypothetical protein
MTSTIRTRLGAGLVLVAVAGISYAAGAAQTGTPVNMPASAIKWEPYAPGNPLQVAMLWGDRTKGDYAMFLKMPAGFDGGRHSHTADYHGVGVQGTWVHTSDGDPRSREFPPGSYVMQPGKQIHNDICRGTTECIIFIHQHAPGDFIPAKLP